MMEDTRILALNRIWNVERTILEKLSLISAAFKNQKLHQLSIRLAHVMSEPRSL